MNNLMKPYEAWWFVYEHPKLQFQGMDPWVGISPHKVNPETSRVEDDCSLNTKVEWWIEAGPYIDDEELGLVASHDWNLDCGGDTPEEAYINLAELVKEHYGDYDGS